METLSYAKPVKANKEHHCNYCDGLIEKGEVYDKSTHKLDGDVYTWKAHTKCNKIVSDLNMYDSTDGEGVTMEHFQETIQEEYQNIMNKNFNEQYESKEFVYPKFPEQLYFVIEFHKTKTKI